MYWFRLVGGTMYLAGMIMMAYNLARTGIAQRAIVVTVDVVPLVAVPEVPWRDVIFSRPIVIAVVVLGLAGAGLLANTFTSPLFLILALLVAFFGVIAAQAARKGHGAGIHRILEGRALLFTVLAALAVLAGGIAELVPALVIKPVEASDVKPYRALEIEGRDVFIKEGCYTCHSQMIRPMRFETLRYGEPSTLAESVYDHPFQWGSKRTGPDLAREGGKYPNLWHYSHLLDPRAITEGSNMPSYAHFAANRLELARTGDKMHALKTVGVPYTDDEIRGATADAHVEGAEIAADLAKEGVQVGPDTEMVAVISYLQRLGKKSALPVKANEAVSRVDHEEKTR